MLIIAVGGAECCRRIDGRRAGRVIVRLTIAMAENCLSRQSPIPKFRSAFSS